MTAPGIVAQEKNPERNAYFGETHIHTSWSFDAYVFGNIKRSDDAYKFAMGQPIRRPAGYKIKITRPLDFMAVTDHSEYARALCRLANDPKFRHKQIADRGKAEGPKQGRRHEDLSMAARFRDRE